jgi:exonuclease III
MADRVTLDQISTQSKYDLNKLCDNDTEDDIIASPLTLNQYSCNYYLPSDVKSLLTQENNSMAVFCLNCQGLKAHWDAFCNLLQESNGNSRSFDVIGITELYSMADGECNLNGYHPITFKTRKNTNDSRGGVAIYIRDNYVYKVRPDMSIFIPNVFESIFIEIQINNKSIIIGNVYRPNTSPKADMDIFMHSMQELQNKLNAENKEVLIMGDMNIDLLKFETHSKTKEYLENIFSQGYMPLITKPTRVSTYSATLIDHIYTNKQTSKLSGIIVTDVADHFGIFCILKFNGRKKEAHNDIKTYRCFNETNINTFNTLLQTSDFTTVLATNCPSLAYDQFINIYMEAYYKAFPIKSCKIPKKYIKRSPWMTEGLIQSSLNKSKLMRAKLRKPTDLNINKYKEYNKNYKKVLRKMKEKYYSDQLEAAKYDMKKTWSILRMAMHMDRNQSIPPEYFNINNIQIKDKKEIVNRFNNFFANIGNNISKNVPDSHHHFSHYLTHQNNTNIFFDPVFPGDIIKTTSKLKAKTSQGHDKISSKLVKQTIEQTALPLTHIINQSLTTGIVPQQMKIARIIPIFKSGDKNAFNNYRPISILPAFSKILEKVVATKLIKYLEHNNLFYQHQYGFRPKHSTTHPIIHLLHQIVEGNDKPSKDFTLSVFIDLSKAFDTISHKVLLHKLDKLGIRGVANSWFRSYLSNRYQYMELYGVVSSMEDTTCGVPQGSILGPILFLIYVNDISSSTVAKILSFADDTTISLSSPNISELYNRMNHELLKLNDWFQANKLCLNVKKTKYILFRSSLSNPQLINEHLFINGEEVDRIGNHQKEKSFKFLGIHIDETLSWKYHIQKVCSKISRSNYMISKAKNFLPKSSLKTLYSSLIQSHINYGILIWGCSSYLGRIAKMQKKSIRIINNKGYNYHTEPLYKLCEILNIQDQYIYNCQMFMYQLKNDILPKSFKLLKSIYFTRKDSPETRQSILANVSRYRTNFTAKLPYHRFPRIWNDLDIVCHEAESLRIFKNMVHKQLIEKYSVNVLCSNTRCRQCFPIG